MSSESDVPVNSQTFAQDYVSLKRSLLEQQDAYLVQTRQAWWTRSNIRYGTRVAIRMLVLFLGWFQLPQFLTELREYFALQSFWLWDTPFGQLISLLVAAVIWVVLLTFSLQGLKDLGNNFERLVATIQGLVKTLKQRDWGPALVKTSKGFSHRASSLFRDFMWGPFLLLLLIYLNSRSDGVPLFSFNVFLVIAVLYFVAMYVLTAWFAGTVLKLVVNHSPDALLLIRSPDQVLPPEMLLNHQNHLKTWSDLRLIQVRHLAGNRIMGLGVEVQTVSFFLALVAVLIAVAAFVIDQIGPLKNIPEVQKLLKEYGIEAAIYGVLALSALIALAVVTYRYFVHAYKEVKALDAVKTLCELEAARRTAAVQPEAIPVPDPESSSSSTQRLEPTQQASNPPGAPPNQVVMLGILALVLSLIDWQRRE